MISDTHKFIFIHINKTGGTSIEKAFEPNADQRDVQHKHASVAFYKQRFPDQFRTYFRFAFVRNPWDWLVSRYHWSKDRQRLFDYSFDEFLRRLKRRIRLSERALWLEDQALKPQLDRLTIGGAIAVDFVGRFENLQGDFDLVCSRLQIEPRTLQHVYKSYHAHYADYYGDKNRKIVEQLYAIDIATFGYRFEDTPRPTWAPEERDVAIARNSDPRRWSWLPATWPRRVAKAGTRALTSILTPRATAQRPDSPGLQGSVAIKPSGITVARFSNNPIIVPSMMPSSDGSSINGPSLIRVPAWIEKPLGRYYLYFAHHQGKYIRLAFTDELHGAWSIYQPGTLPLASTPCNAIENEEVAHNKHLASPDVHVDDEAREIRMYFHGPVYTSGPVTKVSSYKQLSLVATSKDGLTFAARHERLGNPYFRVFRWDGAWYAIGMPGVIYRSADGLKGFVEGPALFTPNMRHSAVRINGTLLQVFYSVVGDNPERILLSTIDLRVPWMSWQASEPRVVLEPQMEWEGANLPAMPSVKGIARRPLRELRDPAIFVEAGKTYLLYSVAGESGIAISELNMIGRQIASESDPAE
jgi:Sulfotransferase family